MKSLFLAFEIESYIMMSSLKLISVQKFVRNIMLAFRIQCNAITCSFGLSFTQQCGKESSVFKVGVDKPTGMQSIHNCSQIPFVNS